jgi:hypothetical protein
MVSRFARGAAVSVGVSVVAGFGLGLVSGGFGPGGRSTRGLPDDLCARLGDVSPLFPRPIELEQTGGGDVLCRAQVEERPLPTHTEAKLTVTVSRYAGDSGRSPDDEAKDRFDSRPWQPVPDRPYPTKLRRDERGEESWDVAAVTVRGDTLVLVEYRARPVSRTAAERAVLTLADKAIWEAQ